MLIYTYYKKRDNSFDEISKFELAKLNEIDKEECLYIRHNLYRTRDGRVPMVWVSKGKSTGFKRKGLMTGNTTHQSRGENESETHDIHVDAIGSLDVIPIKFGDDTVIVYIESVEYDYPVTCNGNLYFVDLYFKLEKTEPEQYLDILGGELNLEVFHTCPVDLKQAEDFAIEGKSLYEYKIPPKYTIKKFFSEEQYVERKKRIMDSITAKGLKGYIIWMPKPKTLNKWIISSNGNPTCKIGDTFFTIFKRNDEITLAFLNTFLKEYNGKRLQIPLLLSCLIIMKYKK